MWPRRPNQATSASTLPTVGESSSARTASASRTVGAGTGRAGMSMLSEAFSWHAAMLTIGVIDLVAAGLFMLLLPVSRRFALSATRASRTIGRSGRAICRTRARMLFAIGGLAMGFFVIHAVASGWVGRSARGEMRAKPWARL